MSKKIFIGLNNIANVGLSLKSGFEEIGICADFYSTDKTMHKYDYPKNSHTQVNRVISSENIVLRYLQLIFLMLKLILRYDYFIFLQGSTLLSNFKDVKLLRKSGKKVSVIFAGCDVRVPEIVSKYKWNPCRNCPESYQNFVGCKFPEKYEKLKELKKNFEIIFSPDECAGYFEEKYHTYYFPVKDLNFSTLESPNNTSRKEVIRIIHAPTNEDYKGSKHIYKAIELLKKKYKFEYLSVQNLSKEELVQEILKCDLVIDQLIGGFYGILAVEAMLLQKPVVCYIRDDIWNKIEKDCPIYNANPDNLEKILEEILTKPELLNERGKKSRQYALEYHSPKRIAENMLEIFNEVR